jgi:transketolase
VIIGDGEANEGTIWEAALFAAQHELNNVIVIADNNGLQAMGNTADILNVDALDTKFASFGFDTWHVNGHDRLALHRALTDCIHSTDNRPKFILADTVKGFGVSFIQNDNAWHYQRLTDETFAKALAELGPAQ